VWVSTGLEEGEITDGLGSNAQHMLISERKGRSSSGRFRFYSSYCTVAVDDPGRVGATPIADCRGFGQ
jgi:hypothetical protein